MPTGFSHESRDLKFQSKLGIYRVWSYGDHVQPSPQMLLEDIVETISNRRMMIVRSPSDLLIDEISDFLVSPDDWESESIQSVTGFVSTFIVDPKVRLEEQGLRTTHSPFHGLRNHSISRFIRSNRFGRFVTMSGQRHFPGRKKGRIHSYDADVFSIVDTSEDKEYMQKYLAPPAARRRRAWLTHPCIAIFRTLRNGEASTRFVYVDEDEGSIRAGGSFRGKKQGLMVPGELRKAMRLLHMRSKN